MVIWKDDMNFISLKNSMASLNDFSYRNNTLTPALMILVIGFIHLFLVSASLNQIGISLDQEEPFSLELDIKAWLLLC